MSEKLNKAENKNIYNSPEHSTAERSDISNEILNSTPEKTSQNIEKIRELVEQHANTAEKINTHNEQPKEQENQYYRHYITKKIKADTYKKTLGHAKQKLSKPDQLLSSLAHQPIVEALSENGAKTIARPSGILGGGIIALFGSITVLFFAKGIGFEVSPSVFAVLFLMGFLLGIAIELLWSLFRSKKERRGNKLKY